MSSYYLARSVGFLVLPEFTRKQTASILGVISQGAYILFPTQRVAFLSFEPFHGALTVNLDRRPSSPWTMQAGEPVEIEPGKILIRSADITVDIPTTEIWRPISPPRQSQSPGEFRDYLLRLAKLILAEEKSQNGFAPLLGPLLDLDSSPPMTEEHRRVLPLLLELRQRIAGSQLDGIEDLLVHFSGIGRGLTPSSDDALVGLLLMLNRGSGIPLSGEALDLLNRSAIKISRQHTTSLAANMIEAATLGAADERLLNTADALLTGWPDEQTCARYLLWYGSSSGMDAFVGMSLSARWGKIEIKP